MSHIFIAKGSRQRTSLRKAAGTNRLTFETDNRRDRAMEWEPTLAAAQGLRDSVDGPLTGPSEVARSTAGCLERGRLIARVPLPGGGDRGKLTRSEARLLAPTRSRFTHATSFRPARRVRHSRCHACVRASAGGLSIADYARAEIMLAQNTNPLVFCASIGPTWVDATIRPTRTWSGS